MPEKAAKKNSLTHIFSHSSLRLSRRRRRRNDNLDSSLHLSRGQCRGGRQAVPRRTTDRNTLKQISPCVSCRRCRGGRQTGAYSGKSPFRLCRCCFRGRCRTGASHRVLLRGFPRELSETRKADSLRRAFAQTSRCPGPRPFTMANRSLTNSALTSIPWLNLADEEEK